MKKLDKMPEPKRSRKSVTKQEGEKGPDPTTSAPAMLESEPTVKSTESLTKQSSERVGELDTQSQDQVVVKIGPPSPVKSGLAAHLAKLEASRTPETSSHVIVKALAGTGKTTTLIGGLNRCFGIQDNLIPSPQQAAVWEAITQTQNPRASCFAAFNVSIAQELARRIPQGKGCAAKTLHGLGVYAVRKSFNLKQDPSEYRVEEIISEIMAEDLRQLRKEKPTLIKAVKELTGLCKVNLASSDQESLDHLRRHYSVEMPDSAQQVYDLVPRVLDRCKDVARDGYIDFDDMIWLPIVLNLPIFKNDLMLVDEAQDLNRCQQEFAKRAGKRLVLCGDPNQAIYGFAGADSDSMPRMLSELTGSPKGCQELPLTVTRRCGKAIVEEAKHYVPEFEAHESNPDGKIVNTNYPIRERIGESGSREKYELPYGQTYLPLVEDGDMILCRANAPLLKECFHFLKMGRRAFVQGRKIGDSLVALLEKMDASSVQDLRVKLFDWQQKEISKEMTSRNPSESKVEAIIDRTECLLAFSDEASTLSDVRSKIDRVFTDNQNSPGIKLSSIHKAKGLESKRVFYIQGFGRPMDKIKTEWERQQERNLCYVAITRAIEELVYVS